MNLIIKLFLGVIVGILLGNFAPDFLIALLLTIKHIFGEFLIFMVPLIIMSFIASGVASLQTSPGKLLAYTTGFSYLSTLLAGLMAYFIASSFLSILLESDKLKLAQTINAVQPFFELDIPPIMSVMTALITAFVFGIGISITKSDLLKQVVEQVKGIVNLVLQKVIIPLLPFFIAGIFMDITQQGQVVNILSTFGFILLLAFVMHWVWLIILYCGAGLISGNNPITTLRTMLPAYFTAIGTMSSIATIPITLRQTLQNGVNPSVANFSIPMCATIHMSGSVITITSCSIAVLYLLPGTLLPSFDLYLPFLIMVGLVMVASPGMPGGAVLAVLGLLSSMLGFNEVALGMMMALYMAQDSFGTACNITGDGAIAMIINKFEKEEGTVSSAEYENS